MLRIHLVPALGDKPLAAITTEDVQQLKSALSTKSPKTVNNVLTVLNVLMRTAVEWNVIDHAPCSIKLLRTPRTEAGFYEFEQFERLVEATAGELQDQVVVLLGGEAGLRCGEMIALEWRDVDTDKRQLCVARSEWCGHVSVPKRGRIRYLPLTRRLAAALKSARHLRGPRVLCDEAGKPDAEDDSGADAACRQRANVKPGVHILRHTFCSHLAMRGAPARLSRNSRGIRISGPRSGTCT